MLELLPMAHSKCFSDSVIPKSFRQLRLAFAVNCRDVVSLFCSFCLMCLSYAGTLCGLNEILTHAFDLKK